MKNTDKEDLIIATAAKIQEARALNEQELTGTSADGEDVSIFIDDSIEKGEDGRYPVGTIVYTEDPTDNPDAPVHDDVSGLEIDGEIYDVVDGAFAEAGDDSEDGEAVDAEASVVEQIRSLLEWKESVDATLKTLNENLDIEKAVNEALQVENEDLSKQNRVAKNKINALNESVAEEGTPIKEEVSPEQAKLRKYMVSI